MPAVVGWWWCVVSQTEVQRVVLACTACQHAFEPDLVAELSHTGCERCGGWTWIAQLNPAGPAPQLPGQRTATPTDSVGEKR